MTLFFLTFTRIFKAQVQSNEVISVCLQKYHPSKPFTALIRSGFINFYVVPDNIRVVIESIMDKCRKIGNFISIRFLYGHGEA